LDDSAADGGFVVIQVRDAVKRGDASSAEHCDVNEVSVNSFLGDWPNAAELVAPDLPPRTITCTGRVLYVANVVTHRPPMNRKPRRIEIRACAANLDAQIEIVRPTVMLALDATATRRMLESNVGVTAARGRSYETSAGTVVPTFHPSPSSLNRHPDRRAAVRADLRRVRDFLDAG
jgi:hypothetical protein